MTAKNTPMTKSLAKYTSQKKTVCTILILTKQKKQTDRHTKTHTRTL